ncbi:hexosaminidase [Mytilus galloprovincialis]|uniref:beta-N-acetylhexosaminidase n=1 Tax=Mytilus galloprovincialis TaxID=29158 RepID=A0A8B6CZ54_MYTGA|nr:hexosaminidase [Mytilus galloprovincialis]
MNQQELDEVAEKLDIKYSVLDNLEDGKLTYTANIVFKNCSSVTLDHEKKWAIYFCHIRMIEPPILPDEEAIIVASGIKFRHINGCLFTLEPIKTFKPLGKNETLEVMFKAQYYSVARSDLMPNWYITSENLKPRVLKCTSHDDLQYVQSFDEEGKWKRFSYKLDNGTLRLDKYNPWTPQERFIKNKIEDLKKPGKDVIPTPLEMDIDKVKDIDLSSGNWIVYAGKEVSKEAQILKGSVKIDVDVKEMNTNDNARCENVITLKLGQVFDGQNSEAYALTIKDNPPLVEIIGNQPCGVFYGVQTLLALIKDNRIPLGKIRDKPRYPYRGMQLDVSRNFHSKAQVLKLLDVMAMYKMNKFHFHLTDDEGWRLEIPGLEELTLVGGRRGHDLSERSCILPMLGSGPDFDTSGTGYYTVKEYQEILQYAVDRHIEVIPEIDMPGHSHAAIKAMRARYLKYKDEGDLEKAREYVLTDLEDNKHILSCQLYAENSMNPGLESTYRFIEKVVVEVQKIHEDVSPLKLFHFGGDEVPYESWLDSPACKRLIDTREVNKFSELMEYFIKKVAKIVAQHDLHLGAWQDGVIHDEVRLEPMKRESFPNKEVVAYAWQNVWESGLSGCAYKLANEGYKVVMAQGTHLYFDHPQEPDPEERGLYWAARYIDTRKTFSFMPDNIYANADFKLTGDPITKRDLDHNAKDHHQLKKEKNIIGMQGQLWSELVRLPDQMDSMIFPRLLPLAERAWHKAQWESEDKQDSRKRQETADWTLFANSLGYKELERLDNMGVAYHIPPPGARIVNGKLEMNVAYPGLKMEYSIDNGVTWSLYNNPVDVKANADMLLRTKSANGKRNSRHVVLMMATIKKENSKK